MAATLQKRSSGGFFICNYFNIITKIIVLRNYFVIVSARMVHMGLVSAALAQTQENLFEE